MGAIPTAGAAAAVIVFFSLNVLVTSLRKQRIPPTALSLSEFKENAEIEDFFVRELVAGDKLPKEPLPTSLAEGAATGRGCNVGKNGTLDMFLRPSSVLDTESFVATIEKDAFFLRFPDASTYKRFSLPAIQMPLETLDRTRECFRLYYKSVPFGFCASNTDERDAWMSALTEALFCFNSQREVTPMKFEPGEAIVLDPESTKDERWRETLEQAEAAAKEKKEQEDTIPSEEKQPKVTTEVEIVNLLEGKPKIFVNGEKLPLFMGKKVDMDHMIEEEEDEHHPAET